MIAANDLGLRLTYVSTGRSDEWGDEFMTYRFFCSQCMRGVNDPLSTDTEMELDWGSCSETTTTAGSRSSSETESEGRGSKRSRESAIAIIAARMNARSLARSGGSSVTAEHDCQFDFAQVDVLCLVCLLEFL